MSLRVDHLDHLVLTVRDVETTCDFYVRALGMQAITFGDDRRALTFGAQKINLHRAGHELEPKAARPTPGSGDLCFLTTTPLDEAIAHLRAQGIDIVEGPVRRTGATAPILSIYIRDPDLNLVEIANPLSE